MARRHLPKRSTATKHGNEARADFTLASCRFPVETGALAALEFDVAVDPPPAESLDDMMLKGDTMSLQSRLEALKDRHANLESRIAMEDQRPRPDEETLTRLKLEKLRLKDEMERLRGQPELTSSH